MTDLLPTPRNDDESSPIDAFNARVEAFLIEMSMSKSRFGDLSCNDRSFVDDMRGGAREMKLSTMRKIDDWMALYRRDPAAASGGATDGREA